MINLLCVLSQLLNGNIDCIELIYKKTKLIEKNENIQYYLLNGLKNDMLYTYNISSFKNEYSLSISNEIPKQFSNIIKGEDRISELKTDEYITDGFLSTFFLKKCQYYWRENIGRNNNVLVLKNDIRYCNHVLINCLNIEGFIKIRKYHNYESLDHNLYHVFEEPSLKQKINALNYIKKRYSIIYLNMLKDEFLNNDIYDAIILRIDGKVESILGAYCGNL